MVIAMSTLNQYRYRASTRVPTRIRPRDGLRERDLLRSLPESNAFTCDGFKFLSLSPSSYLCGNQPVRETLDSLHAIEQTQLHEQRRVESVRSEI